MNWRVSAGGDLAPEAQLGRDAASGLSPWAEAEVGRFARAAPGVPTQRGAPRPGI